MRHRHIFEFSMAAIAALTFLVMYFVFTDLCHTRYTLATPLFVVCSFLSVVLREKLAEVLPGPIEQIPRRVAIIRAIAWIYLIHSLAVVVLRFLDIVPVTGLRC